MKTKITCELCEKSIKTLGLKSHLFNSHMEFPYNTVNEYYQKYFLYKSIDRNEWNNTSDLNKEIRKSKIIESIRSIENEVAILVRESFYKRVEKNFNLLLIESQKLAEDLNQNKSHALNKENPLLALETKRLQELNIRIINAITKVKNKNEYIRKNCKLVYFSWSSIKFGTNEISITTQGVTYEHIKIEGSLKILNDINEMYFSKKFSDDKFKIVIDHNKPSINLSSDLAVIQNRCIIILNTLFKPKTKEVTRKINEPVELTRFKLNKYIDKISSKNEFIIIPATSLKPDDKVFAVQETNHNLKEECLIFIFKRGERNFVLWENSNSQRSGYMFEFNLDNFEKNFELLVTVIQSSITNKREFFFNGTNTMETFKFPCIGYFSLIHTNKREYQNQIKRILKT